MHIATGSTTSTATIRPTISSSSGTYRRTTPALSKHRLVNAEPFPTERLGVFFGASNQRRLAVAFAIAIAVHEVAAGLVPTNLARRQPRRDREPDAGGKYRRALDAGADPACAGADATANHDNVPCEEKRARRTRRRFAAFHSAIPVGTPLCDRPRAGRFGKSRPAVRQCVRRRRAAERQCVRRRRAAERGRRWFGHPRRRQRRGERHAALRLRHVLRSARLALRFANARILRRHPHVGTLRRRFRAVDAARLSLVLPKRSGEPVVGPQRARPELSDAVPAAADEKLAGEPATRSVRHGTQHRPTARRCWGLSGGAGHTRGAAPIRREPKRS